MMIEIEKNNRDFTKFMVKLSWTSKQVTWSTSILNPNLHNINHTKSRTMSLKIFDLLEFQSVVTSITAIFHSTVGWSLVVKTIKRNCFFTVDQMKHEVYPSLNLSVEWQRVLPSQVKGNRPVCWKRGHRVVVSGQNHILHLRLRE